MFSTLEKNVNCGAGRNEGIDLSLAGLIRNARLERGSRCHWRVVDTVLRRRCQLLNLVTLCWFHQLCGVTAARKIHDIIIASGGLLSQENPFSLWLSLIILLSLSFPPSLFLAKPRGKVVSIHVYVQCIYYTMSNSGTKSHGTY